MNAKLLAVIATAMILPNLVHARSYVVSCPREAKANVVIDQDWLNRSVDSKALASNYSNITLEIVKSYVHAPGNQILCVYDDYSRDIGETFFTLPCPRAKKYESGYDHAYKCDDGISTKIFLKPGLQPSTLFKVFGK